MKRGGVLAGILTSLLVGCGSEMPAEYSAGVVHLAERNYTEAAQRFAGLAADGYAPAQFRLGVMHVYGLGVARDQRQALYWIEEAAKAGNVGAQYLLGERYTRVQPAKAREWMLRLAERGFAPAQFQLAGYLARGVGGRADLEAAVAWLRRAAHQGHRGAAERLADAYSRGTLGLERDPEQAQRWRERMRVKAF